MSSDDGGPLPPRRPRPRPQPLPSTDFDEQASTFQPAPGQGAPLPRPKKRRRPTDARPPLSDPDLDGDGRTTREESGGPSWLERIVFGSVSTAHLASFCRQFAGYLDAGVDLLRALTALEKQFRRTALGPVIGRLRQSIRRGETISDAMAREPRAFDRLMLSMMRVAEARGGVPETLRHLAEHYENRVRLFRRARSAMIYPTAVIVIALGVAYLLTAFVLPGMVEILQDSARSGNVVLPLPTRILMGISDFMRGVGKWLVPLMAVGAVFGLIRAYRTSVGKQLIDAVALRTPVLGKLMRKLDTTRFARTLSTLLEAGVDYDASMTLTADVMHAVPYRRAVRRARDAVLEGHELSESLDRSGWFDIDVIEVLAAGEATGKLPESLEHLADDYEDQVEHMVANLGQLIKPVLTIIIGGIVFFIALAFVLAYVTLLSDLMSGF